MAHENVFNAYLKELERYRKHRAGGYKGTSLEGSFWENVSRQNAVRLGNKYKKLTGMSVPGFSEVSRR